MSSRRRHRPALRENQRLFWNRQADGLLAHAESIWQLCESYDTAVRDSIAEGLAFIVEAAFDCRAIALDIDETNARNAFISSGVSGWFRDREFAEWFCFAAASLFRTSRPRTLKEIEKLIVIRPRRHSRSARKPKPSK